MEGEAVTMISAMSDAFQALIGFFTSTFTMLTDSAVVGWVTFGLGVAVLGICINFFRNIVWGM